MVSVKSSRCRAGAYRYDRDMSTPDSFADDLFAPLASPGSPHSAEALFGLRWNGPVAGIDEAGRGPWAGPVVTAAVILTDAPLPEGLTDSKKLSAAARDRLFDIICRDHIVAVASASARRIDEMNVLAANLWAMTRAAAALGERPVGVLVDGRDVPAGLAALGIRGTAIIKGDGRVASIAAASIVAKVTRDRMMVGLDAAYPGYEFGRHKGYGTELHTERLARLGPSPIHRMSFRPVREAAASKS